MVFIVITSRFVELLFLEEKDDILSFLTYERIMNQNL